MLKSSLCDYGDAYMFVKGSTTVNNTVEQLMVLLQIMLIKK